MSKNVDQLSQLLLEADGLLLLLQRHRDETPIDAIKLLRKKLELILALTDGLEENADPTPQDITDDNTGQYIEDTIEDATPAPDDNTGQYIEDTIEDATPAPQFIEDSGVTHFVNEDNVPEIDNTPIDDYADEIPAQEKDNQDFTQEVAEEQPSRRHISSMFNLNDKFRFRRELFGNSDAQYVECLDMLSAMSSLDEAREYLFDDLGWDSNNEEVTDFIAILSKYYS